jgi:hypothetical protein
MRSAARRHVAKTVSNKSATPHHTANQKRGWVMAESSLERMNTWTFSRCHNDKRAILALLLLNRGMPQLSIFTQAHLG